MEGVLFPAERQMASTRAGCEILEELKERILDQAKPYLRQLVEGAIGQEGIQSKSDRMWQATMFWGSLGQSDQSHPFLPADLQPVWVRRSQLVDAVILALLITLFFNADERTLLS